jgi:hypothetical protein
MIVQLDAKATNLQSQWEAHQKSLNSNKDLLYNLETFARYVKQNQIKIDDNNVLIAAGQSLFIVDKGAINIMADADISIGKLNNTQMIGIDAKQDKVYLKHEGVSLTMGKIELYGGKKQPGILITTPNKNMLQIVEDGFLAGIPGKTGTQGDYKISMLKDKNVTLRKGDSFIKMEKDDINIEAKGNINIKSLNGNVNINGKKVNLNE